MTKKWCLEHGNFDLRSSTHLVRYVDDKTTPYRMEIFIENGKLMYTAENIGVNKIKRELESNQTIFIELRERKDHER